MKTGCAPALPHRLDRNLAPFGQRGATLVEALVAFVVLLLTVVAVVRVHGQFRLGSDIARQRSEAVRLGQQDLESLRAYSVIAASSGARSYAEIASASSTIDGAHGYAVTVFVLPTRFAARTRASALTTPASVSRASVNAATAIATSLTATSK